MGIEGGLRADAREFWPQNKFAESIFGFRGE
jgi:hypothetical protein